MRSKQQRKTKDLVLLSIFIAIIILQTWVPFLGYIALPPFLAFTIVPTTVVLAATALGPGYGMIVGTVWGVNSLFRAYMIGGPFERLIMTSPFVAILPRLIMGYLVGVLAHHVFKNRPLKHWQTAFLGVAGSLLNTVLVLGAIVLFRQRTYMALNEINQQTDLVKLLLGIVATNGIPEAIAGGVITSGVLYAMRRFLQPRK